jgi:uncharacterized protein (DUF1499 family)
LLKRTLIGIIRSHESTSEQPKFPGLNSRHFKLPKDKLYDEVLAIVKKYPGLKLIHDARNVGEIVAQKRTATGRIQDVTLTIVGINPVRSAVDIYSASRGSFGDLGSNYRLILNLLREIDRKLKDYRDK